ncbi:hypothetical protein LINGRAHAP2_LOCUS24859 [Linum grandiflorum]
MAATDLKSLTIIDQLKRFPETDEGLEIRKKINLVSTTTTTTKLLRPHANALGSNLHSSLPLLVTAASSRDPKNPTQNLSGGIRNRASVLRIWNRWRKFKKKRWELWMDLITR